MKKVRLVTLILGGVASLLLLAYIVVEALKPKVAGLYIETVPTASVWINGRQVGQTPYRNSLAPGETVIRLIPEFTTATLRPYETKIKLAAGIETVVRYEFGPDEDSSAGEVISFEKNEIKQTSLVAVSVPDSAELVIDGVSKAFTPHKTSNIKAGDHILTFGAQGYETREVAVRTYPNYKLTAIVKLAKAKDGSPQVLAAPSPTTVPTGKEVEILDTGIGFLRVRSDPSSVGEEVGRVEPGNRYSLLQTDGRTGWYRIEFEQVNPVAGEPPVKLSGWISNQFAKVVDKLEAVQMEATSSASVVSDEFSEGRVN